MITISEKIHHLPSSSFFKKAYSSSATGCSWAATIMPVLRISFKLDVPGRISGMKDIGMITIAIQSTEMATIGFICRVMQRLTTTGPRKAPACPTASTKPVATDL